MNPKWSLLDSFLLGGIIFIIASFSFIILSTPFPNEEVEDKMTTIFYMREGHQIKTTAKYNLKTLDLEKQILIQGNLEYLISGKDVLFIKQEEEEQK